MTLSSFASMNLSKPIMQALVTEGYDTPTPIQERAIPALLAGHDLLGIAQTGTGKTAAFALPMLEHLAKKRERPPRKTCRALILAPTRELAAQISASFKAYGRYLPLTCAVVYGGVAIGPQIAILQHGVDVLVATPGRLVDLIDRRAVTLSHVEIFVLDEVDQMLDLGFIHAIRQLTALLPPRRQNLFFSATMPQAIAGLADGLLRQPVRVEVAPVATTVESVVQSVIHVEQAQKPGLLSTLLRNGTMTRTLVFTRTKHGADKVARGLTATGVAAAAMHGNKSQSQRERTLADFKSGTILVLVATDIAARGIDIAQVSHVVNYDLPHVPESYVHRIGRTARAGAAGIAIAFCSSEERPLLRDIERCMRQQVPVMAPPLGLPPVPPPQFYGPRVPPQGQPRTQPHQPQRPDAPPRYDGRSRGDSAASQGSNRPSWTRRMGGNANRRTPRAVQFSS